MHKIDSHSAGFLPPDSLGRHEALPALPAPETAHLSAVAVAASTDLPNQLQEARPNRHERVGDYFDRHLAHLSDKSAEEALKLEKYRSVFADTALQLFGDKVLEWTAWVGPADEEYSPPLYELGSMLASLDHNAGVYYGSDDVESLFGVVAQATFGDEATQKELSETPKRLNRWTNEKAEAVSSLERETALPLVRDAAGTWRVAGASEYGQNADFQPLEILRQDNTDKSGWNKYRFRSPTYTRHPDELHTKPVAEGWFTSAWYQDPNYWSAQMRKVMADTAKTLGEQLADSNTQVLFSTEGGIFKGTARPIPTWTATAESSAIHLQNLSRPTKL